MDSRSAAINSSVLILFSLCKMCDTSLLLRINLFVFQVIMKAMHTQ